MSVVMWIDFSARSEANSLKPILAAHQCTWQVWDLGEKFSEERAARANGTVVHICGEGPVAAVSEQAEAFITQHSVVLAKLRMIGACPTVEIAIPVYAAQPATLTVPLSLMEALNRNCVTLRVIGLPCSENSDD